MDSDLKDYLKTKLVETCLHLEETEENKKASSSSYNEEIKGSKERVKALSRSIKDSSTLPLSEVYGDEYVDSLEQYVKDAKSK